jgi:lysyl-tRNA synthetase class II
MTEQEAELHAKVEWYDLFVDRIYDINRNAYNEACEYADNNQFKV